jgi:hypothetical protein
MFRSERSKDNRPLEPQQQENSEVADSSTPRPFYLVWLNPELPGILQEERPYWLLTPNKSFAASSPRAVEVGAAAAVFPNARFQA